MSLLFHELIKINTKAKYNFFKNNLKNLQKIQLSKVKGDYNGFLKAHGLSTYANYCDHSTQEKIRGTKMVPTSGSTHAIKWIPYTKDFSEEMAFGTHPWLHDIYNEFPEIKRGKHFWSMSWLPHDLRATHTTDDLTFFSFWERQIMKKTMAIDKTITLLPTVEDSMIKSLQMLLDQKVTLISVWSPTFLLEMLEMVLSKKEKLLNLLICKKKRAIVEQASELNEALVRLLLPDVALVSSWNTSTSFYFSEKVKKLFQYAKFQGKGLMATEGVVTIPFEGQFLLSYCSHFYEFQCVETEKIFTAFELEKGMKTKVIITAANGFKRYQLHDIVEVEGHRESVPILKFIGRDREVDMVGEKLNQQIFSNLITEIQARYNRKIFSFLGIIQPSPCYFALMDTANNEISNNEIVEIEKFIEKTLYGNFHYRLAREAGQLDHAQILLSKDPYELYMSKVQDKMKIRGNIKIEPVALVVE